MWIYDLGFRRKNVKRRVSLYVQRKFNDIYVLLIVSHAIGLLING